MDRTELIEQLKEFRQACFDIGCINSDNKAALELEEAYPGVEPVSYIIDVTVKQEWLDKEHPISALKELIDLFYEKVDGEIRKNILTIKICETDKSIYIKNLAH
jgi:hypothetical protein